MPSPTSRSGTCIRGSKAHEDAAPMTDGDGRQISIRAHFERFPATIKGAFVVGCADRDPHQVVMKGARVVEVGIGEGRSIGLQPVTLQAAPKSDLFVRF